MVFYRSGEKKKMKIVDNNVEALTRIAKSSEDVFVCTPFFSMINFSYLENFLKEWKYFEIWTKINVNDWCRGYSDLSGLRDYLNKIRAMDVKVELFVDDDLHAKIYKFGCSAILGSANFTDKAFKNPLEIMVEIGGDEIFELNKWIDNTRRLMKPIQLDIFNSYIDVVEDEIIDLSDIGYQLENDKAEGLNAASELAEEILYRDETVSKIGEIDILSLGILHIEDFIRYCRKIRKKNDDADEIVKRYEGKHNLQGHVKQSYYGVQLFYRYLVESKRMVKLMEKNIPLSEQKWMNDFKSFIKSRSKNFDGKAGFRMGTLRRIIPDSVGGVVVGGGGGISTLSRIFGLIDGFNSKVRR